MALTSGTKLGPYTIQAQLGAGGMGEVYRARDTRLDRTVAIKVLPSHLSSNPELKQRLEREAKAISSLNHPHICTLHDIGSQDGLDYLVMEYLDGESLSDRLKRGPLPLEQALRIAMEVAEALDRAHRSGITHRDLKPGNIMLTKDGAKVLDFGLAKMRESGPSKAASDPNMQTMTAPLTSEGSIVGTLQYMAPEQLEGKQADARSDIFAFGTVLYEMVTGRRAFDGSSQASVIAAILEREPKPLSEVQPLAPALLDHLLRACLAKDPDDRPQTAHDVILALQWIGEPGAASPAVTAKKRWPQAAWIAAIVIAAIGAGSLAWMFGRSRPAPVRTMRFGITLPAGESFGGSWWWLPTLALSRDGSRLAYVATNNGVTQLYLRELGEWDAKPLPGTGDANTPFFSPDGQWLGAFADGKLLKVPVAGGPPVTIVSVPYNVYGACWAADDTIYFDTEASGGILKVPSTGGTPQRLTVVDTTRNETEHRFPEVLPGGETMLFTVLHTDQPNFDDADIEALSLKTGKRQLIVRGGTYPHYIPTGYLVFLRGGVLLAAPFDPVKLELKGAPTPVAESVIENPRIGAGQFAVSAEGSLVYIPGGVTFGEHDLVFVDRNGTMRSLTAKKRPYEDFSISPDGKLIATTIEGPETDTWIHDIARDTETRFTLGFEHRDPAWSADGKYIVYSGYKDGKSAILSRPLDGNGEETLVTSENPIWPWFWSRDGRTLLYVRLDPQTREDVWALSLDGDRKPRPVLNTPFAEEFAQLSPDGRWIAYNSDESGRAEVYVMPFPGLGPKVRVSTEGGRHPQWSPDGKELYYRIGVSAEGQRALGQTSKLMAVPVESSPAFKAGMPNMLFQGPFFDSGHDYAVTPDGKGFIFIRESQSTSGPTELKVVLNWFDELKRQVHTGSQ